MRPDTFVMRAVTLLGVSAVLLVQGCAQPAAAPARSGLDTTPDLARFERFDLIAQAASAGQAPTRHQGSLAFSRSGAAFDSRDSQGQQVGRLFVQPDACHDAPGEDCQRRFAITGRLTIGDTAVNCYVPVRNDTSLGYAAQALTGICQDRHGRLFSLTLFTR
ncbi:MAG: hypothetical protein RL654_1053 [Pseudomonadota bacterium]|jgi:hypothetical protein